MSNTGADSWTPGSSWATNSTVETLDPPQYYIIPEDIVFIENALGDGPGESTSKDCADFVVLLNNLISEICYLEERRKELMERSYSTDFTKTAEVVVSHCIMIKMRLEDTLEDVIARTYEESRDPSLFLTALSDWQPIISDAYSPTSDRVPNNKVKTVTDPERDGQVMKKLENIESLIMQIIPDCPQITKNSLSLPMGMQQTPEERKAKLWLHKLRTDISDCECGSEIEALGSQQNIETTYSYLCKYPNNIYIGTDCLKVLQLVSEYSEAPCKIIYHLDCFSTLCDKFSEVWPKWEDMSYDIIRIIFNLTRHPTVKHTLHDNLLELFLKPLENECFRETDIACGDALINLIITAEDDWNLTMARAEVERKIEKGMKKWVLGKFSHLSLSIYSGHLKRVLKRDGAIRHFSLWYITNQSCIRTICCNYLKEQGAVKMLNQVLAKDHLDPEIGKLASLCLKNINNDKE